jgi:hypothetical protein
MSVRIRIPLTAHAVALHLAAEGNRSIGDLVAEALARYDEEQWWTKLDAAYARLRADPVASAEYDAEVALWDTALMDGLDEWPYEGIEELLTAGNENTTR